MTGKPRAIDRERAVEEVGARVRLDDGVGHFLELSANSNAVL